MPTLIDVRMSWPSSTSTGTVIAATHPFGDPLQQHVTGLMAVLVVDQLEVVEVAEEHADRRLGLEQRSVQAVREQHPVGQTGECVVQRLVLDLVAAWAI